VDKKASEMAALQNSKFFSVTSCLHGLGNGLLQIFEPEIFHVVFRCPYAWADERAYFIKQISKTFLLFTSKIIPAPQKFFVCIPSKFSK